jgi:serine/threonine protein phosphatase PrpC
MMGLSLSIALAMADSPEQRIWFDIASGQVQGARARQEDSLLVRDFGDRRVALLADGLGGHPSGDEASRVGCTFATATLLGWLMQGARDEPAPLRKAYATADEAVRKLRSPMVHERPPATTLVGGVLFAAERRFEAACVGDSLALLLRDGQLISLFEPQGSGNCVQHALGIGHAHEAENAMEILDPPLRLQAGDRLLLASDGIEVLAWSEIARALSGGCARDAAEDLLGLIIEHHEPLQDNCSIVVIVVHEVRA